jgi:hypothetical protein
MLFAQHSHHAVFYGLPTVVVRAVRFILCACLALNNILSQVLLICAGSMALAVILSLAFLVPRGNVGGKGKAE